MVDNTIALGIRPMQIDLATPLMQAAKIRQADTEARANDIAMKREAIGAEVRGLAPFLGTPEFDVRHQEAGQRLRQQGVLDNPQAINGWETDARTPLGIKSIIARTEDPRLQFQREQAKRSQSNVDREFEFKKSEADKAAKGVEYREIEDEDGRKVLVRINKSATDVPVERVNIGGAAPAERSPYAPKGKLTEPQSKDRLFVDRMIESHKIISDLEGINEGKVGYWGGTLRSGIAIRDSTLANAMASKERQSFEQAKRNFINAVLRKESGAVIADTEFSNAERQYFPVPGDDPNTIEQKRQNRMQAIEGLMQGAGPGYKPPKDYVGTKGPAYPGGEKPADVKPADVRVGPKLVKGKDEVRLPKVGEIRDGYRFKGGNPGEQSNWVKVE